MKLIAETKEENLMLPGLSALLEDFDVAVAEYRTDESYAMTFWSACEFMHMFSEYYDFSYEDSVALLEEIEPYLQTYMAEAGIRFLCKVLRTKARIPHRPSAE